MINKNHVSFPLLFAVLSNYYDVIILSCNLLKNKLRRRDKLPCQLFW